MSRPEEELLERLGNEGLKRVLADLLDRPRLVRLANACGLKYPGMRTLSQNRKRVLADLVGRAQEHADTRRAILRALQKETRAAQKEWNGLSAEDKAARLGDQNFLLRKGNLGLHLYFLAMAQPDGNGYESLLARQQLLKIAENGTETKTKASPASRTESRLKKKIAELEKKVVHLEGQISRSRESERNFKRDLIQRKGELAEARMLTERLSRELAQSQAALRQASVAKQSNAQSKESLGQLAKAVKRLATEQAKLGREIGKLPVKAPKARPIKLAPVTDSIQAVQKDLAAFRRDHKRKLVEQNGRVEELRAQLSKQDELLKAVQPKRRTRVKPGEERVGVFIDVQNMYYGARQLKGKLDFDALLQAAVLDRRLIQATAYVVESKEIDQSGFIALLQQRALDVRRKTLRVRADGSMKGDWDMELALDILEGAPDLDVVVLVSGDGDFTSLVKRVKKMGPKVEVIGFPRTTAKSLVGAADRFHPLDSKFMIYKRRVSPAKRKRPTKAPGGSRSSPAKKTATAGSKARESNDAPRGRGPAQ